MLHSRRFVSVSVLTCALAALTMLAAGPLRGYDVRGHRYWARLLPPHLQTLLQDVLDRIAGQAVDLPVLALVAVTIALRLRSWRPIVIGAAAEAAFYGGVGGIKVLLARPAPTERDAHFFDGGIFRDGWHGISYPSGHAAEAILVYGTAVYLIARYTSASRRTVRLLSVGVGLIALNAVVVSYTLGWHWATDLIGGLLTGGLFLRVLIWWDTAAIEQIEPVAPVVPVGRQSEKDLVA